jgi:hypothetical protein
LEGGSKPFRIKLMGQNYHVTFFSFQIVQIEELNKQAICFEISFRKNFTADQKT